MTEEQINDFVDRIMEIIDQKHKQKKKKNHPRSTEGEDFPEGEERELKIFGEWRDDGVIKHEVQLFPQIQQKYMYMYMNYSHRKFAEN